MNIIAGHPGGSQVVKKLHKDMALAHDLEYREIPKISWSDLKSSYRGAWVIIQGTNGTGAIKSSGGTTGSYDVVASDGSEIKTTSDSRGGNIVDFIKSEIGKPLKFYTARHTTSASDKQRKRADMKQGLDSTINQDAIIKKFRPLWSKALTAAIADVQGHVANMVRNGAFEKARHKLDHAASLQNNLDSLQSGSSDTPSLIGRSVNTAILMAAAHHYPDETGDISRGYSGSYSSARPEGPKKLLQDITNGDTQKLGTVLGFFKRTLISG